MKTWHTIFANGPQPAPEYVGLTEKSAISLIWQTGYYPHVADRDGELFPMSASLSPSRIVISVKEGVVTKAIQG